jgi:hypothetical protein
MSEAPIIIAQELLSIKVGPFRMTALPATGPIVTLAPAGARTAFVAGLHGTSAHVMGGTTGYIMTIAVLQGSVNAQQMRQVMLAIDKFGRLPTLSLTYNGTSFISGGASCPQEPTYTWAADAAEYQLWAWNGMFPGATIGTYANDTPLSADQIESVAG